MVKRRSTVRFCNGAPGKQRFSNESNAWRGASHERRSLAPDRIRLIGARLFMPSNRVIRRQASRRFRNCSRVLDRQPEQRGDCSVISVSHETFTQVDRSRSSAQHEGEYAAGTTPTVDLGRANIAVHCLLNVDRAVVVNVRKLARPRIAQPR